MPYTAALSIPLPLLEQHPRSMPGGLQPTTTVCFQYGLNHTACTIPPGHLHPVKHTSFCFWALLYCQKRMSLLACHHIWFGLSTVPFNFMRGNLTARLPWTASIVFQYPSSLQLFAFRRSEKMRHQSRSSQHRLYDAPITPCRNQTSYQMSCSNIIASSFLFHCIIMIVGP